MTTTQRDRIREDRSGSRPGGDGTGSEAPSIPRQAGGRPPAPFDEDELAPTIVLGRE